MEMSQRKHPTQGEIFNNSFSSDKMVLEKETKCAAFPPKPDKHITLRAI